MTATPDFMPVLSFGAHDSPEDGGCFMEIASFLAGEEWSDRPRCADPALADAARKVNDTLPDDQRQRLAPMIPDVIGTRGLATDVDCLALAWFVAAYVKRFSLPRAAHLEEYWGPHDTYFSPRETLERVAGDAVDHLELEGADLVDFLRALIDKFKRLTGHERRDVEACEWQAAKELVSS